MLQGGQYNIGYLFSGDGMVSEVEQFGFDVISYGVNHVGFGR